MTPEERRIQYLMDVRVFVREEVLLMRADLIKSIRLMIKEELQLFNQITEIEKLERFLLQEKL